MTEDLKTFVMEADQSRGSGDAILAFFQSAKGSGVQIDASNAPAVSARQLQVMISAKKQWAQDALPFSVTIGSGAFADGLRAFGVSEDHFAQEVSR